MPCVDSREELTFLSGVTSTLVLDLKHISHDLAAVSATLRCVYTLGKDAMSQEGCGRSPKRSVFTVREDENELSFGGG